MSIKDRLLSFLEDQRQRAEANREGCARLHCGNPARHEAERDVIDEFIAYLRERDE